MKLTKLEKIFVNSNKQTKANIKITERLLNQIDISKVKNVLEIGCGVGVLSSYLSKKYKWNVIGMT